MHIIKFSREDLKISQTDQRINTIQHKMLNKPLVIKDVQTSLTLQKSKKKRKEKNRN